MTSEVVAFPPNRRRTPQWTFADRVRKVRRELRLTQAAFAQKLGVGDKAYGAWESGFSTPSDLVGIAQRLEDVTGYDRQWFLGWLDGPGPDFDGPGSGAECAVRDLNPEPAD